MAIQLFRLRNVPEDEADEIRELLHENQIDFYETPPDNWGVSMPAIWLKDETQIDKAKALLETYQAQRQQKAQALPKLSLWHSWWLSLWHNPVKFIAFIILIGLIVYFSIMPFFDLSA